MRLLTGIITVNYSDTRIIQCAVGANSWPTADSRMIIFYLYAADFSILPATVKRWRKTRGKNSLNSVPNFKFSLRANSSVSRRYVLSQLDNIIVAESFFFFPFGHLSVRSHFLFFEKFTRFPCARLTIRKTMKIAKTTRFCVKRHRKSASNFIRLIVLQLLN